jgi:mono/diheme cytochrome c family protein
MAVLIFVIFWVLVAIGLVFIALSGGPGGARARLHAQSRGARRLTLGLFALTLLVLGAAAPAFVIAGVEGRDSIPEASVDSLTAQEERGREVYSTSGQCYLCHTLKAANSSATVGPNLDQLRPTANLVLDAVENGRARGNGAMAADLVQGEDAEAVAAFVAKAVGQSGK